ncbi:protein of unknown function [Burkholderia multivorans]
MRCAVCGVRCAVRDARREAARITRVAESSESSDSPRAPGSLDWLRCLEPGHGSVLQLSSCRSCIARERLFFVRRGAAASGHAPRGGRHITD